MTISQSHDVTPTAEDYGPQMLLSAGRRILKGLENCTDLEQARKLLTARVNRVFTRRFCTDSSRDDAFSRARDCCRTLGSMLAERSDRRAGFSVAQALWDISRGRPRPDLTGGFHAEMVHLVRGLLGAATPASTIDTRRREGVSGRTAAIERSRELDRLWQVVQRRMSRYADGLSEPAIARRTRRRQHVMSALSANDQQWHDWQWQIANLATDADKLTSLVTLSDDERSNIARARAAHLPFAVTPYYASLMDDAGSDDAALRAQVIPPRDYVDHMLSNREVRGEACDFMLEADTSPVDLVTRRYPAVAILKPYNTCPQICVYCQRNWEITDAVSRDALAPRRKIDAAIDWLADHPAIQEVLVTGGDPLMMDDDDLAYILKRLAAIPHVDLIRIGTRTPVTLPMRITDQLADLLGSLRSLGRRDIAVMTHVEHPYEITPELAVAVDRLRRRGIGVYNQQVYTFYTSRRFESALLRLLLRRVGIDPYYTFAPKGKRETLSYRLPVARILQERKEEARLLPGIRRTDEPVINLPGLGKNYLRAWQHHDLLSVLADGSRVYEFHPWEKNVVECDSCVMVDMPILDYLRRLADIGEDVSEYESIWYYY